jgi:hypothetical protein
MSTNSRKVRRKIKEKLREEEEVKALQCGVSGCTNPKQPILYGGRLCVGCTVQRVVSEKVVPAAVNALVKTTLMGTAHAAGMEVDGPSLRTLEHGMKHSGIRLSMNNYGVQSATLSPMLATKAALPDRTNPFPFRGWYASSKLDGVRAIWNGSTFTSSYGNILSVPKECLHQMPGGVVLDGVLYGGENTYHQVKGLVRRQHPHLDDWRNVSFHAMDIIPDVHVAAHVPFSARCTLLNALAAASGTFFQVVQQTPVKTASHFYRLYGQRHEGQGIELRNPDAPYEHKRTSQVKYFCR